ncbi:tripartite tricarboxylate transporter substrate-binding protein, partial [Salmonella enterica subsp. enterica serovar Typhimurium]|nr:tripartite tricarboxylate transporter substrate-binding protein [Salmonella enterica subsp. enterica serovar Typhimurium]
NVPTVAEQGFPGFRVATWSALVAPAGTPAPLVEQINAAIRAASRMETVASAIRAGGSEPKQASTSEFSSFLASELTLWAQAARRANVELQ